MKPLFTLISILFLINGYSQTYCLMVDQNNGSQEYLGTYDISTGLMNQISTSPTSSFANNGTSPVIDPINRKYIYSNGNPGPVKIIDLDNGSVVDSFYYPPGVFPRHFAYNELDSTMYCLMTDMTNGWKEAFGTFDISSGTMTQISTSTISSFVNNGTTPVIDPINRKYVYASNTNTVKIIDLDNGSMVDSFYFSNGIYPRHFAYNQLDLTMYCLIVDQNNGAQEYLGTFNTSSGLMSQISITPTSNASTNNGTNPTIDPINRKYIYSTKNPGPVIIIDLDNGTVVDSFSYNNGFFPRHFAYIDNGLTGISNVNDELTFKVYPNPTSHQISIFSGELTINEIKILDSTGKLIKTIKQSTNTINVSDLSQGIYFVQILSDKKTITKKFVIQ